jgi:XTP/dITP diphosphohydrolase
MARVVLATRNAGKIIELRRILAPYDIDLAGLDEFPDIGEIVEHGASFVENA